MTLRRGSTRRPTPEEEAEKLAARAIWETDRAALLFERPFVATLALRMPLVPVVDHRVPTACTDGQSIWFNPAFLRSLSAPERVFVLAHEIWHCALLHPLRRRDREPVRWNIAVDQEVNALLLGDGWTMPANGVYDPTLDGLSAEEIYERLSESPQEGPRVRRRARGDGPGLGGGAGTGAGAPAPLDVHLEPGPAGHRIVAAPAEERPASRAPSPDASDRGALRGAGSPPPHDPTVEDADAACVVDPDFTPREHGAEAWEGWPGRVRLVGQQLRGRGVLSAWEDALLLRLAGDRVDWRRVLRDFVTRSIGGARSWSPPARRHVHRGLYLPSLREPRLEVAVAIDTSASVHAALPAMLGELHALLSTFGRWEARVLWADSAVQRDERWTDDDPPDFDRLPVPLGGGTDFRPVFAQLAADPPRVLVYVTDGAGPAPSRAPDWPVLWVLTDPAARVPAGWGQAVWFEATNAGGA